MRFVIAPALQSTVRQRVRREFPESAREAAARADRVVEGEYDLLGYRGLRFDHGEDGRRSSGIDWHRDPVHGCRAPRMFWADVPYLDPASGDHKIIWELNRHQHWLTLGRAFWLTGDTRYPRRFVAELEGWLGSNAPLTGVNWSSMLELAFRSVSWIWALHFFADGSADVAGDRRDGGTVPWTVDLLLGLDRQLTHVEQNLSHYFSPNTHLLGEALALYVAGRVLPELSRSRRRETIGRRVLVDEIARQISEDGGHCERSTHYHRYTLDFYLLALAIARITDDPIAPVFERAAGALAAAARILADASGHAPHIGDDDGGMLMPIAGRAVDDWRDSLASAAALLARPDLRVGPTPEEPFWLLAHPTLASALDRSREAPVANHVLSAALPDTGYFVSRSPAGDHLIVDGGPHGYRNAGHAHADALSLTFTRRGLPLLIDPGTACYTIDADLRDRMRSTPLHNTLVLDRRSQSTPRGPFHWSTAADSTVRRWRVNGGFDYFDGAHDGYLPLTHRRHVLVMHGELLVVADLVSGPEARRRDRHEAAVHWHVDPRWRVEAHAHGARLIAGGEQASFHTPHGLVESLCADESGLGWQSPVYGRVEPATTIRVTCGGRVPLWIVSVFGLDPDNAVEAVDTLPVWAEAGVLDHSTSVRITRRSAVDYLLIAEPAADSTRGRVSDGIGGHTGPPLQAPRVSADLRVGPSPSDGGADLRVGPAPWTWRVADIETDARMLFCSVVDQQITRIALVDGSFVRSPLRHGIQLALPRIASDLHVDLPGVRAGQGVEDARAHITGPACGASLVIDGVEWPIADERRGTPRASARAQRFTS